MLYLLFALLDRWWAPVPRAGRCDWLTTLVYAWELNSGIPTEGVHLLWLLIAVVIDVSGLGGGAHRQRSRR